MKTIGIDVHILPHVMWLMAVSPASGSKKRKIKDH